MHYHFDLISPKEATMSSIRALLQRLAMILAVVFVSGTAAAEERLEWWAIDKEVGAQLLSGKKNLIDWAKELAASEPKTPYDAVLKLNVCMRAALDDDACAAVRSLWSMGPELADNSLLIGSYHKATDDYAAWDVARVIVETFAPRVHGFSLENRLFKHYRAKGNKQRWSDEEFIAWFDARIESVRRYDLEQQAKVDPMAKPPRFDPWRVGSIDYWRRLRLQELAKMGRAGTELKQLEDSVRAHPADAGKAMEYLVVLNDLGNEHRHVGPEGLNWMADICRPARATDLQRIAMLLVDLEQYKPAETFFRRAIDTEITDGELEDLGMMCQAFLPEKTHRLLFQIGVREDLAKCLLKMGQPDLSQQVMIEAADMRLKHKLPLNPYLSGMVQNASSARVIEGRIREKEQEDKNDPNYWRQRAEYYRGRGEAGEEESALRRGLALCEPAPQAQGKASMQMRYFLLNSLVHLLASKQRAAESVRLLLKEMNEVPIDSASSEGAARLLENYLPMHLDADEPILWKWLAKREKWDNPEERLLWRIIESKSPETRDPYYARIEKLALSKGADASRAATLGWILNRMGQAARSTAPLKHALKHAQDDELKQIVAFTLFETHLDLKDWRAAESIFDLAEKQLTPSEAPEWLGRIALLAAEKGSAKNAMRIFRRVANCNLRETRLVGDLSKLGLRDELRDFYAEVQRRLPNARLVGILDSK